LPLEYDAKTDRYYAAASWRLPPSKLTSDEALAVVALATEFGRYRELPFYDSAYNAAAKLEKQLPKQLRRGLQRKAQAIKIRPNQKGYLSRTGPVYRQLVAAVEHRRAIHIVYKSLTEWETIETDVRPYQLLFSKHSWYVLGHSSMHDEVRTFNLARIDSIVTLAKKYAVPRSFDLDRHFNGAWCMIPAPGPKSHVVVRFEHLVAKNVAEVEWHKSQSTKFLPDNSLEFHVTVSGLDEISWWILGYGDQAEVIKPERLRRLVCQRAKNMVAIYGEDC
jgi:predicted DNA-binding transcriptional regulator YafY